MGDPQNHLCGPCTGASAAGEGVRERETRRYPHPPRAPWLPHRTLGSLGTPEFILRRYTIIGAWLAQLGR